MKTHHDRQEVNDEVLVIEDFERDSSPLTELSSLSPPPGILETPSSRPPDALTTSVGQEANNPVSAPTPTPVHQPEVEPEPSSHQAQEPEADLEEQRSEPDTPHTVLEPLPAPDPEPIPVPTGSLPTSESRADDAKPQIKKLKLKGKKKGGPESQFSMNDSLRDKRLLVVGPDFEVDNDKITHQQVGPNSRATMSRIFGGNPQRMISYPSPEKKRAHGFTSGLLFPSRSFNPLLPTKMGERGLLFRLDQKLDQWVDNEGGFGPYHLMMHHTSDDYWYSGVYEFVRVNPVTKDEWLAQSSQVRREGLNHAPLASYISSWTGKGQLGYPCA